MTRFPAAVSLAAAFAAAPLLAQSADAPLGEILKVLPKEGGSAETPPAKPLPVRPVQLPPNGIGTMELPPSQADGLEAREEQVEAATELTEAEAAQAEADALWAARQEARRAEINAEEAPIVARLNERIVERHEAIERENEEARLAWERRVAALESEKRARAAAHRAALEAHRREVARQQADHRRRVTLCLQGAHEYCAAD